jgi:hypothetical protein
MKSQDRVCSSNCPAYPVCGESQGSQICLEVTERINNIISKSIQDAVSKQRRGFLSKKLKKEESSSFKIVEGVGGMWHYHLSKTGENYQPALCGKKEVMRTSIPLINWGRSGGNVPSSYCSECDTLYKKQK